MPVPPTEVTVPPVPVAAISIPPAVFVIVTPVPWVRVAREGSAPVLPITNWPLVATPNAVTAPVPLPNSTPWSVKVDAPVPPFATVNAVSKLKDANSAAEPDTITFFQFAILLFVYFIINIR